MGKRKSVSFGEPQVKEFSKDEVEPKEDAPAKIRRNNRVIENTDFDFGTADQRAENQNFVNEKVQSGKVLLQITSIFRERE